ncbi:MAG TPA: S8 family serine peptidase, partial [Streptosporangiaceae bacterium]|nr:S8 family serine peptidase [Streptosporangiaceae bacterium]
MLRPAPRSRRWRTLAAVLAALMAAPALAVGSAGAAQADGVRQQELWVLNAINVAGAWQHTRGSGVTVALIDSGVNGDVSDLTGSVVAGRDFSGVDTPPANPNWGVHGTWMASLIAGHGHPPGGTSGIMGVAPAAKVLSIRAVTDQGDPEYHRYQHESESRVQGHLAAAIQYAAKKGVSVISMSLGYQGASRPVRAAIAAALAEGIVVVASSGNSGGVSSGQHGNAPYSFPADYPGVLGVGAVAQDGQPAGFSSDNLSVQVAAPGVRVPAEGRDGQYWLVSGTSPACALTAGVAALIKSVYPALAPALVVQAITASASNRPHGGYDEQVGSGTVDATAALRMAGRLARDQGAGHGLIAAAQLFGGGTAAIPPVPVTPRGKRQFVVDSLVALVCLAFVLIVTFRLIVTRRPAGALAGVPGSAGGGGRAVGDGRGAWGAAGGWAGTGAPNAGLPD